MGLNGTVREGLHMKFDKVLRVKEYISEIDVALKQIDHGYRAEEIKIW